MGESLPSEPLEMEEVLWEPIRFAEKGIEDLVEEIINKLNGREIGGRKALIGRSTFS
jgi:hypothetical protein